MAGKNQHRVTLREFRAAFNEVARLHAIVEIEMPKGFKKKLESVFPSTNPASSVTARQFYRHARETAFGENRPVKGDLVKLVRSAEDSAVEYRLHLAMRIMEAMPTLRAYFEEAKQESVPPKRANTKAPAEQPPSLEERVANLERENAALRQNSGRTSAEDDAAVRRWYQDHDTRIGGDHDPGPMPGLRD